LDVNYGAGTGAVGGSGTSKNDGTGQVTLGAGTWLVCLTGSASIGNADLIDFSFDSGTHICRTTATAGNRRTFAVTAIVTYGGNTTIQAGFANQTSTSGALLDTAYLSATRIL
jgi:hypothetical protein